MTLQIIVALSLQLQGNGLKAMLLRGGLGSLCLKIASTILSLLMAVVLARALGAEGYGLYSYVMALVTLLALPAQAGLPTLVVRETAKAQAAERWGLMRGLWRWSSLLAITLSLFLIALALALIWLAGNRFGPGQLNTFYFGLLLVPLIALGNLRGAALRGLGRVVQGQLPETLLRPGLFVLFIAMAYAVLQQEQGLTPAYAMAFHAAAAGAAFIVGACLLYRARPEPERISPAVEFERTAWRKSIMPLVLVSGISMINAQADILMLGWFHSAREVGLYRVAASSVGLMGFGMTALNSVVAPHFARLYAQGNMAQLQIVVTRSGQAMMVLALPVFLVFSLAGESVLKLVFGTEFGSAQAALVILSFGNLASVAVGSVGALLNMTGHERDTARGAIIAASTNIVLNVLLIPLWGLAGAATATAVSLVTWSIVLWRAARAQTGIFSGIFGSLLNCID